MIKGAIVGALRRGLAGAIALLLLGAPAESRPARKPGEPPPVSVMAWEVQAKGDPRPDYILGTAHFPVADGARLSPAFDKALGGCKRFLMEADLDGVTPETVSKYVVLDKGERLEALVPKDVWKRLLAETKALGLSADTLMALEPWYISMLLTLPHMDSAQMLDSVLRAAAEKRKVAVSFLESPDDVLSAMDSVKEEEELAMLVETLDDLPGQKRQVDYIAKAYQAGDLAAIQQVLFGDDRVKKYPDYYDRLLFNRNRLWLPKIEAALRESDTMVAVGLGHLVGEEGLLAALRAKGYAVKPIKL